MPAASAGLSRLLFLFLQWPLTVLMKQTGRQHAPLSSLYYLDVYGWYSKNVSQNLIIIILVGVPYPQSDRTSLAQPFVLKAPTPLKWL